MVLMIGFTMNEMVASNSLRYLDTCSAIRLIQRAIFR